MSVVVDKARVFITNNFFIIIPDVVYISFCFCYCRINFLVKDSNDLILTNFRALAKKKIVIARKIYTRENVILQLT